MGYYSDPTASKALGNINREFSQLEKKAKKLCKLYRNGKLTDKALQNARSQFSGLYRYVLDNAFEKPDEETSE